MVSGMNSVLGKILVFGLRISLCAGGLLPKYPIPNGTVASETSSRRLPGLGNTNAHSPTEYWCFDTLDIPYMECCGLGDADCGQAAVCFDRTNCQGGCELDMSLSAESGPISFTCAAPIEACATAVRTLNNDGIPTTSSILSCVATVAAVVAVTITSATRAPLESGHTGYVGSSEALVESEIFKTATSNSTKATTLILPGISSSQDGTYFTSAPAPTAFPVTVGKAPYTSSAGPVSTSSALPATYNFSWKDGGVIGGIVFGGCIAILTALTIAYNIRHNRQVKLEKKLTRRRKGPAAVTGVVQAQEQAKVSQQGPGGGGEQEYGYEKEKYGSSVTTSSSSTTATTVVATTPAAIPNGGMVYDSSDGVRCANSSAPSDNNSSDIPRDDEPSCSFDTMDISEVVIQEAMAVRYYQPHTCQRQIVQLSNRE